MAELRYIGTATWSRVLTKDDGSFDKMVAVKPGDVVKGLDDDASDKLADTSVPRGLRTFVIKGSDEDPYKDDYEDPYDESSNPQASDVPKLDMGSTRPGGEPHFELTAQQKAMNARQVKAAKTQEGNTEHQSGDKVNAPEKSELPGEKR